MDGGGAQAVFGRHHAIRKRLEKDATTHQNTNIRLGTANRSNRLTYIFNNFLPVQIRTHAQKVFKKIASKGQADGDIIDVGVEATERLTGRES